jgi:hypothetical protein
MNCGLPAEVIWTGVVVVLHRVEIRVCDFSCPAGAVMSMRQSILPRDFPLLKFVSDQPETLYGGSVHDFAWIKRRWLCG